MTDKEYGDNAATRKVPRPGQWVGLPHVMAPVSLGELFLQADYGLCAVPQGVASRVIVDPAAEAAQCRGVDRQPGYRDTLGDSDQADTWSRGYQWAAQVALGTVRRRFLQLAALYGAEVLEFDAFGTSSTWAMLFDVEMRAGRDQPPYALRRYSFVPGLRQIVEVQLPPSTPMARADIPKSRLTQTAPNAELGAQP